MVTSPADASWVRRAELVAALRHRLATRHRLVLTGPAGVGKSIPGKLTQIRI